MVQLILNPAYLPIADVSEIGLFGEILPNESVGVFIWPFFPRMVKVAKIGFRLQCFGYLGVLALSIVKVCTLSSYAINALTAARVVSLAFKLFNLQIETFAKFLPPDSRNLNTGFRLFLFQISTDSTQIPP